MVVCCVVQPFNFISKGKVALHVDKTTSWNTRAMIGASYPHDRCAGPERWGVSPLGAQFRGSQPCAQPQTPVPDSFFSRDHPASRGLSQPDTNMCASNQRIDLDPEGCEANLSASSWIFCDSWEMLHKGRTVGRLPRDENTP